MTEIPEKNVKKPFKKNKKNNIHYVDNSKFLEEITKYRNSVLAAKEAGTLKPRVPNYIGECFLKIATHLAYKSNFINYTYREEMVSDGIENCITYIDNFNPEKSNNPFAYFTQITYYSFIRRIKKEARQAETKLRYLQSIDLQQLLDEIEGDSGNYEYLNWIQEQIDANAREKQELSKATGETPKRRPKYFDEVAEDDEEKELELDEKVLDNDV